MPIAPDVDLARDVRIPHPELVNLYGCSIGSDTLIGAFVEIQKGATIGRRCKISTHTFICEGVTIEDGVFVGHGVMFINDRYPRATAADRPQTEADWELVPTLVKQGASIGSGAVIFVKYRMDFRSGGAKLLSVFEYSKFFFDGFVFPFGGIDIENFLKLEGEEIMFFEQAGFAVL